MATAVMLGVADCDVQPDTGHASAVAAAAVGQDVVGDRAEAARNGLQNVDVAGLKAVSNDGGPVELDTTNGHAPELNGQWLATGVKPAHRNWPCVATPVRNGLDVIGVLAVVPTAPVDVGGVLQVPTCRPGDACTASSSASSRRAPAAAERCSPRWFPPQACTARRRRLRPRSWRAAISQPTPISTALLQTLLRRSNGHVRSPGVDFTHILQSLSQLREPHARLRQTL